MSPNTAALLKEAKASKQKRSKTKFTSYLKDIKNEEDREIFVLATCRRVIKTQKKAIQLLADK